MCRPADVLPTAVVATTIVAAHAAVSASVSSGRSHAGRTLYHGHRILRLLTATVVPAHAAPSLLAKDGTYP